MQKTKIARLKIREYALDLLVQNIPKNCFGMP